MARVGASGKTTLAELLVAAMGNAHLVHVDVFYSPSARRAERLGEVGPLFDLPRPAEQVILPGSLGGSLRYQRYDWTLDVLAQWIDLLKGAPVVLEGAFCLAAGLRECSTFKIWCHADAMPRLNRGLARNGEQARSTWVNIWMPSEDEYAANQPPQQVADLVVDSSTVNRQEQRFRAVVPA